MDNYAKIKNSDVIYMSHNRIHTPIAHVDAGSYQAVELGTALLAPFVTLLTRVGQATTGRY